MSEAGQGNGQPEHPAVEPPAPSGPVNGSVRGAVAPKFGTPLRAAGLVLAGMLVMAAWPLLGIMLTRPYFDSDSEAFALFGGLTMFPMLILALLIPASETALLAVIVFVWLAAAAVPGLWLRRRLGSWKAVGALLGAQSAFSFAQAAMGALLILGKSI